MGWTSTVSRKFVQGATVAATATTGALLALSVIFTGYPDGWRETLNWALSAEVLFRVGLPSFVAGVLFFPVRFEALISRAGFTARAALTTAAVSVVNRVLVWADWLNRDSLFDGVRQVLTDPSLLLPVPEGAVLVGLDWNALLGLGATATAALAAYTAQPLLLRLARSTRLTSSWPLAAEAHRAPLRVRVR